MQKARVLFLAVAAMALAASSATASPYVGAVISVYDIAGSDVPGPQPIRAFPVPAAAGWAGSRLIYNNWGEGLQFSPANDPAQYQYYPVPLSNADITINGITNTSGVPAIDNTFSLYTNTEGSSGDPDFVDDNRFPYRVPRLARSHADGYLSVQFDLAEPTTKFGVFLPASSNTWGPLDPQHPENTFPQNYQLQDRSVWVFVQGVGDTFATAQKQYVSLAGGSGTYCPFLVVEWNGTDLIKSVSIVHDVGENTDKGVGFMDVYVIPEPATMLLLGLGGLGLIRRRKH